MINRKKLLKIALIVFFAATPFTIALLLSTVIKDDNNIIAKQIDKLAASIEPQEKDIVRFVSGTHVVSDSAPLVCGSGKTYTFYGEVFNTTDRIVGIDAQDTAYSITIGGTTYNLDPFIDPCVTYMPKINYLYPGESTKAYFAISELSDSSENVDLTSQATLADFQVNLETDQKTDTRVKDRLEDIKRNQELEQAITYGSDNYLIRPLFEEADFTAKKAAIATISAILLLPLATIVGSRVYKVRTKKD